MNFLITGGTGFIGKHLTAKLITKGHHVFVVTRSPQSHKNTKHVTYLSYQDDVQDFPAIYRIFIRLLDRGKEKENPSEQNRGNKKPH
ncbi:NAD-dependent epimerase/dehydratase family protein [Oceanobacillus luteolus]|uniref:NAD-dependent epimerase/dehydratase family protein n=1 Tax=Oceanobacillus luteolus TaxID=1274358 RepID=A0ABW4HNU7_9BACI